MSKHTQGPYQLHSRVDGDPTTGDGSICITRPDGLVIAHIVPKESEESIPVGRLMASAPQLLSALEEVLAHFEKLSVGCPTCDLPDGECEVGCVTRAAYRAVFKAKGAG